MAVDQEKLLTLINSLISATEAEKVEWTSTSTQSAPTEDTYSLSLTRGTVIIWSQDGDGTFPFMLQIRGDQGQVVEEIRSAGGGLVADGIAELFRVAMNSARNANAVIDSLIDDLTDPF
ncbi:hypothetical protein [Streptomyces sp. NPDC047453]|uniref:hypothetical protein n=1 Tax=Streptomyces sp. NPDC047453 TaxID=3154812 RepID=UPI0033FF106B